MESDIFVVVILVNGWKVVRVLIGLDISQEVLACSGYVTAFSGWDKG